MDGVVVGLACSVLGILTGIIAVVCGTVSAVKKHNIEARLRESIIQNHVDADLARVLVTPETPKVRSRYTALSWGFVLLGIGLGYVVYNATGLSDDDLLPLCFMAIGCGLGLLVSFFVRRRLDGGKGENENSGSAVSAGV